MLKRISVKYALKVVAVFTAITTIFVPIYIYTQKNLFISHQKENMSGFFVEMTESTDISDPIKLDDHIEEYNDNSYIIRIYDSSQKLMYTNRRHQKETANPYREPGGDFDKVVFANFSKDAQPKYSEENKTGNETITLQKIVSYEGKNYYIFIKERMRNLEAIFSYTNNVLVSVLAIYIIVCGLSLFLMMGRLTKSIRQLNTAVKNISNKDYSVRYKGEIPKDEVGELAVNFNDMADTIQDNINSISNYNFLLKEDINNLKKYEDMRNKFVRTTTHELKTPLAIISGQVEMMNCTTDPEKKKYYYNSVIEEIQKMSMLITGFLQYSADERETFKAEPEEINLSSKLTELCRKITGTMHSKSLNFTYDIESGISLSISEKHIEHIFNNYIMNAVKHTPKGKNVKVTLTSADSTCRLSVYNDGPKIPENQLEKIWSEFYSRDKSSNANVGLGLFIVKEIALINGTDCGVENHENGVEFWFDF